MLLPLAAVPNRNPDIIVLMFDEGDTLTVRKTYDEAANAIIFDEHINRGFEKATAFWFEPGNHGGEEILPVDVTHRVEGLAQDIISDDERDGRYDRAHNDSLRHPS